MHNARTLDNAAGHRENQRHGHVGGIFGEHTGRIGDGDAAAQRRGHVNIVHPIAEIGNELHLLARLGDQRGVNPVCDGGHKHISLAHGLSQLGGRHRLVIQVEPHIKQFAHARFNDVGQFSCHYDQRFFLAHAGLLPPLQFGACIIILPESQMVH